MADAAEKAKTALEQANKDNESAKKRLTEIQEELKKLDGSEKPAEETAPEQSDNADAQAT